MGRLEYDDSAFAYFGLTVLLIFTLPYTYYFLRSTLLKPADALGDSNSPVTSLIDQIPISQLKKLKITSKSTLNSGPKSEISSRTKAESTLIRYSLAHSNPLDNVLGLLNFKSTVKTLFLVILWSGVFRLATLCYQEETQLSQFDPYEILNLARSASEQEIRKKYRKLSVEWHPDQWRTKSNEDQQKTEAMFIKITKAYTALTDEVSRENYKRYGNPDGPQPMELSLGLPAFLLDKKNHNVVLLVYIIVLVVVIPTLVFIYYSNSKKYSDKLILNETYQIYAYLLNQNITMKHIVEVLSLSAEYRKIVDSSPENEDLIEKVRKVLVSNSLMPKKGMPAAVNLFKKWKGADLVNVLLHAHFYRLVCMVPPPEGCESGHSWHSDLLVSSSGISDQDIRKLRDLLNKILIVSPILLEAMMEIAQMKRSLKLVHKVVALKASLVQAVYPYATSSLFMVPGLEQNMLKKLSQKGINEFEDISKNDFFDEKNLNAKPKLRALFPDEIIYNVQRLSDKFSGVRSPEFIIQIGCMDFEDKDTGKVFFDEKCGVEDVVTIYFVLNFTTEKMSDTENKLIHATHEKEYREQFASKKSKGGKKVEPAQDLANLVHAPFFPQFLKETFCVTVGVAGNEEHLLGISDFVVDKDIVRRKIMFKPDFKKPGMYQFDVFLKSKCYLGIDKKETLKLNVVKQEEIEQVEIHPEDLETEKMPGLFDVFDTQNEEHDSDFDLTDDEKEKEKSTEKTSDVVQAAADDDKSQQEEKGIETTIDNEQK